MIRMLKIMFFITVLLLINLTTQYATGASTETIIVYGESPIYQNQIVPARKKALEDAFRTAVKKVLGTMVTAESYTRNAISIDNSIVTKAKGYIKTYEILGEQIDKDVIVLKVKVVVSVEPIRDALSALKILIESMGNPQVAVLVKEDCQDSIRSSYSARRLTETLSSKGFYVVDLLAKKNLRDSVVLSLFEEKSFTDDIIRKIEADMLLLGEGRVESITTEDLTGLVGTIVTLNVKVFRLRPWKLLAEDSIRMNGVDPNRESSCRSAFSRAGERIGSLLIDKLAKVWSDSLLNGRDILVEVKIDSYDKLMEFKRDISRLFGVKQVFQKSFKENKALFLLRFTGSSQTLTDIISTTYFGKLKVKVDEISGNTLRLSIR